MAIQTLLQAFWGGPLWPARRSAVKGLFGLVGALGLAVMVACGGGGGGGSSKGASDPGLNISPSSLSFSAHQGDPVPPAKGILINVTSPEAVYVGAAWVGAAPSWITTQGLTGSGKDWSLVLQITGTNLVPGTYTATLRMGVAKSDQSIIGTRDAVITYQVTGSLDVTPGSLSFDYVQGGAAPAAQNLAINGSAGNWTASANQAWITLGSTSGATPASLGVQVNPAGLSVGIHSGVVTVQATTGGSVKQIPVTLTVAAPGFQTSASLMSFTGVHGSAQAAQSLSIAMNTGSATAWTATADDTWVILSKSAGTTPDSLTVNVDPSHGPATGGIYHSKIRFAGTYGGVPVTQVVDVDLNLSAATLTVDATTLSFSSIHGAPLSHQGLHFAMNNGALTAWIATADDAWVVLSKSAGTTPDSLTVSVDSAHGPAAGGVYHSKIHFTCAYGGNAITQVINVDLNLSAAALTVDAGSLSFSGINGAPFSTQNLNLGMNNGATVNWTATSSASWLVLSKASGTTSDLMMVTADPTHGPLASGAYNGVVTLQATYGGTTLSKVVNVSLTLTKPTFSLSTASLVLGGANGRDTSAQPLQLRLNTGGQAYPWTATPSSAWITTDLNSGTVSASATTLNVSFQRDGLMAGTYAGALDLAATVNGDVVTASLPITLNLEAHRLLASDTGVAFASMPSLSKTTRTLQVKDNFGQATAWTASSDQAWLSVTASGTAGGDLVLTADPTGLTPDTIHYATISLGTSDVSVENSETIKVGFWVGSASPDDTAIDVPLTRLVVDPIRPYAYVHNGGTSLTIYNIYTCTVVGTIPSVATQLGDMTISNDGSTLYVTDAANFQIVPVNLGTQVVGNPWVIGMPVSAYLQYVRTNGKELIIAGNRSIFDAKTGVLLGGSPIGSGYNYPVSASLNGDHFSIAGLVYRLDHTSLGGGQVLVGAMQSPLMGSGDTGDWAFSNDGTRFYMAIGAPYNFYVVSTTTTEPGLPLVQTLPGSSYPNNVEMARDGRIFCAIFTYGPPDVWVYAPNGDELARYQVAYLGVNTRNLKVSGEGLRMITIFNDPYLQGAGLTFTTVAP